jgi:TolB-like protein/tetratricopeptide (TPR) repeat protein
VGSPPLAILRELLKVRKLQTLRNKKGDAKMIESMQLGGAVSDRERAPAAREVLAHLDAVTRSPGFASAPKNGQLLRYLVERVLAGQTATEYGIGVDVFERLESFNPSEDSVVRTAITRLRQKLREYYAADGQADGIRIQLPPRSYTPVFVAVAPAAGGAAPIVESREPPAAPRFQPRFIWGAIALIAAGAVAGIILWQTRESHRETPVVAILPFLNLTGDPGQDYLSDSISDELTAGLAETNGLRVIARTSAFQFKGKAQDVREIGRRLNASALLEGSVARSDGKLQLIVQLVNARSALHLWSKTFQIADGKLREAEAETTRSTQLALLGRVTDSPVLRSTGSPEAHDLYLRAVYLFSKSDSDSLRKSLDLVRQAVKLDASFVRAHWLIVKAEHNLAAIGAQSAADARRNSEANLKAVLSLDPNSSDAHGWLAYQTYVQQWDWAAAEKEFRIAVGSGHPVANALNLYGWSLITRGRFAEAHNLFDSALEIDPLATSGARTNRVIAWIMERKYEQAKQAVDSIFQINSASSNADSLLGWIAAEEGDCAGRRRIEESAIKRQPATKAVWDAGTYAICGSADLASQELAQLVKPGATHVSSFVAAELYGMLGDPDHAGEFLNRAAEAKEDQILYLAVDPALDRVRGDARVQALIRRIGLPTVAAR